MKKRLVITLLIVSTKWLYAQQEVQYTQYMFNAITLNPAYAGHKGEALNTNLTYRNQWAGESIAGAPRTIDFNADYGIPKKHIGLGFELLSDQIGAQKNTSVFLSTAYRFPVSSKASLALGLAFGFSQYRLDGTLLNPVTINDAAIPVGLSSTLLMDAKFGIYLTSPHYYIGLSAANLFNNNIDYTGNGPTIVSKQRLHYFLMAGFLKDISESLKYYPSMLVKEDFRGPTSIDFNNFLLVKKAVWFGLCYRTAVSIFSKPELQRDLEKRTSFSASVQLYATKDFRIGYSYDFNIGSHNTYLNSSHEISIGYIINLGKSNILEVPNYIY